MPASATSTPHCHRRCCSRAPRRTKPSGCRSLSAREFEVFRLLAQGHSSAQCAQALGLSPKTISNHETLIKEKLGVLTSAALVHLALRHELITPSSA